MPFFPFDGRDALASGSPICKSNLTKWFADGIRAYKEREKVVTGSKNPLFAIGFMGGGKFAIAEAFNATCVNQAVVIGTQIRTSPWPRLAGAAPPTHLVEIVCYPEGTDFNYTNLAAVQVDLDNGYIGYRVIKEF